MKQQFVPNEMTAQHEREDYAIDEVGVYALCPWADVVIPCEGGWQAFESKADADLWEAQL